MARCRHRVVQRRAGTIRIGLVEIGRCQLDDSGVYSGLNPVPFEISSNALVTALAISFFTSPHRPRLAPRLDKR